MLSPTPRGRFGKPFRFVAACASTQRLLDGEPEGAVVATDEQTEGRGRLGRSWHAPAGTALLFSIALEPRVDGERLPELSLVAGEAVAAAIERVAGVATSIKPPNDVLVDGRKVAGILAEASDGRVVLGIGVNVAQSADDLPSDVVTPATSLALEDAEVDRTELLEAILEELEKRYDAWTGRSTGAD